LSNKKSQTEKESTNEENIEDDNEMSFHIPHANKEDNASKLLSRSPDSNVKSMGSARTSYNRLQKKPSPRMTYLTTKEKMEQKELKECTFKPDISLTSKPRKCKASGKLLYDNAKKLFAYKENIRIAVTVLMI